MVPQDPYYASARDVEYLCSWPVWLETLGYIFNKIIYILGFITFGCIIGKAVGLLP